MGMSHLDRATIPVEMKRGGTIMLDAEGYVYDDEDGAGYKWTQCDDFAVLWNGGSKGKRYAVDPKLFNEDKAIETFIKALSNN